MIVPGLRFIVEWSYILQRYVAKCDARPVLRGVADDPEDALADLVWEMHKQRTGV